MGRSAGAAGRHRGPAVLLTGPAVAMPSPCLAARLAALPPAPPPAAHKPHVVAPLRSAHLRLRLACSADIPVLQAHWNRPEVRRHLFEGREVSLQFATHLAAVAHAVAAQHGGGLWLATRLDDGAFIGTGALLRLSGETPLELLLTLEPAVWGRGHATELGQRLLRYAFEDLHAAIVLADLNPPNPRLAALAQRLGMRAERRASWPGTQFFLIDRKMRAAAGKPAAEPSG